MTIEITRLSAQNNQPHQWSWVIYQDPQMYGKFAGWRGVTNSKKEAIAAVQVALESLK